MGMTLEQLEKDETLRRAEFPACRDRIFMAHAAVTAIPQCAVNAMNRFNDASGTGELDYTHVLLSQMDEIREVAARLIEAEAEEIALLGPTSLGLSLVANGIDWKEGDEIITYLDDYPANVYPWKALESKGVRTVFLKPEIVGEITPELIEKAITPKTRLFALASCNFLTGYRLDIETVGELAEKHGILFCLDAIQTVGAFPTSARHVDFLSADSHKWMLGPMTAGIFRVKKARIEELAPSLLGAWNVKCPNFVASDQIEFEPGGRKYEPGVLNAQGLFGMKASMELILDQGVESIASRLLELKEHLVKELENQEFEILGPKTGPAASSISTFTCPKNPSRMGTLFQRLLQANIVTSFRHSREGVPYIRLSPHFYNTHQEVDEVLRVLGI